MARNAALADGWASNSSESSVGMVGSEERSGTVLTPFSSLRMASATYCLTNSGSKGVVS